MLLLGHATSFAEQTHEVCCDAKRPLTKQSG
jgi:hypothetical protein